MRLVGKVAVITGSASGQGKAAAELFAREGAKVVVSDVNQDGTEDVAAGIRKEGGEAIGIPADVSDQESVRALMERAIGHFGRLDVLYNNAGINTGTSFADGRFETMEPEVWDRVQNVNLRGIFLCCKYAVPRMVEQQSGSIINTASIAGLIGIGGRLAYSASKGGVIALTKALSKEVARDGVTVNCVAPRSIRTPMIEGLEADLEPTVPVGRLGDPDDVAAAVAFLCSAHAGYVTGEVFVLNGGVW